MDRYFSSTFKMESSQQMRVLLLVTLIFTFVSTSNCDIRCHCNQPACVRTGYMCKSTGPQAACFVEHSGFVNVDRSSDISRHGCIEMLPIEERTPCLDQALETFASQNGAAFARPAHGHGGHHRHHKSQNQKSITCCLDDMCNYVKTIIKDEEETQQEYKPTRPVPAGPWIPLKPRGSNPNKNDDIDSLGKHLQDSYGVNDSIEHEGNFWFELLTFGIIVVLLAILVLLILFGVRFIRQNDCNHQKSLTHLPQTQLPGGNHQFDQLNTPTKRSMLDWKCFMSSRSANPHLGSTNNRSFNNVMLYGGKSQQGLYHQKCQTKHSLLLSVKVDVDSQNPMDPMTKLDADDLNDDLNNQTQIAAASNLPNIICEHTLPPEKMMPLDDQTAESHLDNRAPMNASKFGRERQNSIYLSLLPPQSNVSTSGGQQNPNFDLISGSN